MRLPTSLSAFLLFFLKQQKVVFILIAIFSLAWSLDATLWPYAFKLLIDHIIGFTGDKADIWVYLIGVLIFWLSLWLSIEVMFRVQGLLMARAWPRFEAKIRMAMYEYVQQHSYTFFSNHFAGNIANKINDMTRGATRIMQLILTLFLPALVALLIACGIFLSIDYWFAVLLFGWTALHMCICFVTAKRCIHLANEHSQSRSFLAGKIVDAFTNIITIKSFARHRYEYQYMQGFQHQEQAKHARSLFAVEKVKIILGFSSFLFPGVLFTWYQIYSWQQGILSVGDLVLIFNATWNIVTIAWMAGIELPNVFKEIGICQQALTVIKAQHDIVDCKDAQPLQISQGTISLKNLSFSYLAKQPLFTGLSVEIEAGTKVGLVSFSGSGKSTFVNLLVRFFEPQAGQILLDGQDIQRVTLISLRQQIAMIPQQPSLFHRSLFENIRYGKVDASFEEVISAAKKAHCHDFIMQIPDNYQALVGERGIKLSGGQRQRVAIARAILSEAPILVLDEATSALDSVTERYIQKSLQELMGQRTTLVVAHRLSTLIAMDRILVFDKGQIIEDGTHAELLHRDGHYTKLWRMQVGGFLLDQDFS